MLASGFSHAGWAGYCSNLPVVIGVVHCQHLLILLLRQIALAGSSAQASSRCYDACGAD